MNLLEAMAKALHDDTPHWPSVEKMPWRNVATESQAFYRGQARAALLALSECELPEEIAQEGGIAGHVMDSIAVDCFRAMLRAIANAASS